MLAALLLSFELVQGIRQPENPCSLLWWCYT